MFSADYATSEEENGLDNVNGPLESLDVNAKTRELSPYERTGFVGDTVQSADCDRGTEALAREDVHSRNRD